MSSSQCNNKINVVGCANFFDFSSAVVKMIIVVLKITHFPLCMLLEWGMTAWLVGKRVEIVFKLFFSTTFCDKSHVLQISKCTPRHVQDPLTLHGNSRSID